MPRVALAGAAAYLSVLTAAAWRANRAGATRTALAASPHRRFLILIPAHNEERLIASSLKSIAELDYPAALVTAHVVADNCADATVDVVRALGVEVHEHVDLEHGGKGAALQWLLERLWARGDVHDAVVIIDADTTLSPNFLRVMDAKLGYGARVVQAYYAVRDADLSAATGFRAAALSVRHYLRPLGRTEVGGSAGLYGNGMVFAEDVLRGRTWTSHLTEDIAFQLELLMDGTPVAFAPDAVVEAEMPATLEAARTQNERWERGRLDLARRYLPRLVHSAVSGGNAGRVAYSDAAIDQLVPPFSIMVAGTAVWSAATLFRVVVAPSGGARRDAVAAGAVLAAQAATVLSGLYMVRAPASIYRSLLGAPRQVIWKTLLWLRMLLRPQGVEWVRTSRNADGPPAS